MYGSGVDLVYIPEIKKMIEDPKDFFVKDHFTGLEIKYCSQAKRSPAERFAGKYAAKEAFIKALDGLRLNQPKDFDFKFIEAEVRNDDFGRPYFKFHETVLAYLKDKQIKHASLSISHTHDYAMAQVILS